MDNKPQKNNPHTFILGDALEYVSAHGHEYDAIHASPPCQRYSSITPKHARESHPDLIAATRDLLRATGKPYVIENVTGARMVLENPFMLCGTMFGLRTPCGAELQRHRYFEANFFVMTTKCHHNSGNGLTVTGHGYNRSNLKHAPRSVISIHGDSTPKNERSHDDNQRRKVIAVYAGTAATSNTRRKTITVTGSTPQTNVIRNQERETFSVEDAKIAMGIPWMIMRELSQAIPPAYTFWIGQRLLLEVERRNRPATRETPVCR